MYGNARDAAFSGDLLVIAKYFLGFFRLPYLFGSSADEFFQRSCGQTLIGRISHTTLLSTLFNIATTGMVVRISSLKSWSEGLVGSYSYVRTHMQMNGLFCTQRPKFRPIEIAAENAQATTRFP